MASRWSPSLTLTIAACLGLTLWLVAGQLRSVDREFPRPFDIDDPSPSAARAFGLELSETDLIPNGGFESWEERAVEVSPALPGTPPRLERWSLPQGWELHHWYGNEVGREELEARASAAGRDLVLAAEPRSGRHGLDLGFGRADGGMWFGSELFEVEGGASYVLSLWVRMEGLDTDRAAGPYPLEVQLRAFADPERSELTGVRAFQRIVKLAPGVDELPWRRLQWHLTMPLGVRWATLQLESLCEAGEGRIVVDDAALHAVLRRPHELQFDARHGFSELRLDNLEAVDDGLELSAVEDLSANGGFDRDRDGDGRPDGWTATVDAGASVAASDLRFAGDRGLEIATSGGTARLTSPPISLAEAGVYTLSAYFRSPPRSSATRTGAPFLAVRRRSDGATLRIDAVQAEGSWVRESLSFDHPGAVGEDPAAAEVELLVGHAGRGRAWVDEVQLERSPAANRLARVGARFVDRGSATSPILDLGFADGVRLAWRARVPTGRRLVLQTRTGLTPYHDPATWTDWSPALADPAGTEIDLAVTGVPLYLQWRAYLERDDPVPFSIEDVDRSMTEVAPLPTWHYRAGGADPATQIGDWPSTDGLEGLALPAGTAAPTDAVWYGTRVRIAADAEPGQLFLRLPFAPGLKRETTTTVFVGEREVGRREGGSDAWFALRPHVEAGFDGVVSLRVEGPGADRFRYLTRAAILRLDPGADAAMKVTPLLRSVTVSVRGSRERRSRYGDVQITRLDNGRILPQLLDPPPAPDPADDPDALAVAELAREIVHDLPMDDEEAQILALRKSIFALCTATGSPSAYDLEAPDDHSADILRLAVRDRVGVYCSQHWRAFLDLATAVGFVVRPVTTGTMGRRHQWADNVVEYWSNTHSKWVMVNTFWDQVLYRHGVPQSAAELMDVWYADRWEEIEVRAGGDLSNAFRFSADRAVGPLGWYAIPPHRHANSHGWVESVTVFASAASDERVTLIRADVQPFFLARRLWSGNLPYTTDPTLLYGPINQTRLRLRLDGSRCIVDADHNMPWFSHFERRIGDGAWTRGDPLPFTWSLQPGANVLRVRAVNHGGRPGPASRVMLRTLRPFPSDPAP